MLGGPYTFQSYLILLYLNETEVKQPLLFSIMFKYKEGGGLGSQQGIFRGKVAYFVLNRGAAIPSFIWSY